MTKQDKKTAIVVAVIAAVLFLWLFLRNNPKAAQAVQNGTGLTIPGLAASSPQTFSVGSPEGYQAPVLNNNNCGCAGSPWQQPELTLTYPGTASQIAPLSTQSQAETAAMYYAYQQPFGGSGVSSASY